MVESDYDLLSGYHLALLRPFKEILGAYLAWVLQGRSVAYQFHVRARGVTRYGLTHVGSQSVRIPLPPLSEQCAIVRYLDHVDRRIRRYITAKQKLIDLLEEEKQAIINQAVTRGLDPNVRLKPSGVEWLGDVPEHWEVLGGIGRLSKGQTKEEWRRSSLHRVAILRPQATYPVIRRTEGILHHCTPMKGLSP